MDHASCRRIRTTTTAILQCVRRDGAARDGPPTLSADASRRRRIVDERATRDNGKSLTNARRTTTATSTLRPPLFAASHSGVGAIKGIKEEGAGGREVSDTAKKSSEKNPAAEKAF
jgi:hypothetical protein